MPTVRRSVLVAHRAVSMFELVDRVEDYPRFLPWCGGSAVLARDARITRARIDIDFRGLRQSFTTENAKTPGESIRLRLVEGPFSALHGSWTFQALSPAASKVTLELDYAFGNVALEKVVGPVFSIITETMVDRFVARADALAVP
ncbi:MAG: type II toxin-antitoxin system RatA family toxin [Betaproteobacteria bacterium]|nr:type II toxin-antitoxin system RatA family toxin [Betaproteobacteria bacterium]